MAFVNTRKAVEILGVHPNTLRSWDKNGKIKTIRTPTGQRLYDISDFMQQKRRVVCYSRVSSAKQKDDLKRQTAYLKERWPEADFIEDIGSGLNFKRKGLSKLIDQILEGRVEIVVVAHKDRLCRFGFDLFAQLCEKHKTQILVLDNSTMSAAEELTRDITTIIHVFSCRLHGLRKYNKKIQEDSDIPK